ncbi:DUF2892 domain-containing protein [Leifsonia sp. SIMBA_070]|uniref:YgaP family membrane protein n=1 Tax=Leifsonia sp. SIMBA_070 TaxID=3085810 RepID=UPI00397B181F
MKFSKFMASTTGRITRIVAGLIIIAIGALLWSGWGVVLIIVGLVPLAAGIFDWCVIAPLLRLPVSGAKIRAREAR